MITPDLFHEQAIMVSVGKHEAPLSPGGGGVVVIALTWADIPREGGSHLPHCEPLLDRPFSRT